MGDGNGRDEGDRTLGKKRTRRGDFWAHLLADILVRIGLFVATVVLVIVNMPRRFYYDLNDNGHSEYWFVALAAATLAAILGPWLYRTATHRGRGTLSQVKRDSERQKRDGSGI